MATEHSKWREFLQPVVAALATFLAAGAIYLQQTGSDDTEQRIRALEIRVDEQVKRSDRFGDDIDKFKVLLSDIRSDVSFIRGRMEQRK